MNNYYEKYPGRQSGPNVTITQNWDVLMDHQVEPCDSDFSDDVTLFVNNYEDEEWWYTMETIN